MDYLQFLLSSLKLLGTGVAGYLINEYQNRIHPFIRILGIIGTIIRLTDLEKVDPKTIQWTKSHPLVPPIKEEDTISNINECRKSLNTYLSAKPELLPLFDEAIRELGHKQLTSFMRLLRNNTFETIFVRATYNKLIKIRSFTLPKHRSINYYKNKDYDGSVIIEFPQGNVIFGSNYDQYQYLFESHKPFLDSIAYLRFDYLISTLQVLKDLTDEFFQEAQVHFNHLDDISNNHSQWGILLFFANNSNSPILIDKIVTLKVIDKKTKAEFVEDCYLAVVKRDNTNKIESSYDVDSAIVLKGQESTEFLILTKNTQAKMDSGKSFRDAFDRGTSRATLNFTVEKKGLIKRSRIKLKNFSFVTRVFQL